MNNQEQKEVEIDLGALFRFIAPGLPAIILTGIIVALAAYLGTTLLVMPQYTSTTKMYIMARNDSDMLTSGDMQVSSQLSGDYAEIVKSREVIENVIARLQLQQGGRLMKQSELLSHVQVETVTGTRIVKITVTNEDPYLACDIANAIREESIGRIQSIMNAELVQTVDAADIPTVPSNSMAKRNAAIGAIIGILLALIICIVLYVKNDKIETPEDAEHYLGLVVLGAIPRSAMFEDRTKTGKKGRRVKK